MAGPSGVSAFTRGKRVPRHFDPLRPSRGPANAVGQGPRTRRRTGRGGGANRWSSGGPKLLESCPRFITPNAIPRWRALSSWSWVTNSVVISHFELHPTDLRRANRDRNLRVEGRTSGSSRQEGPLGSIASARGEGRPRCCWPALTSGFAYLFMCAESPNQVEHLARPASGARGHQTSCSLHPRTPRSASPSCAGTASRPGNTMPILALVGGYVS